LAQIDPSAFANLGVGVAALVILGFMIFTVFKFMGRHFDSFEKAMDRNSEALSENTLAFRNLERQFEKKEEAYRYLGRALDRNTVAVETNQRTLERLERRG
jgi:hypothetical protein